jgi:hypothetical protein
VKLKALIPDIIDGERTIWVKMSDTAGNNATSSIPVKIDTVKPAAGIIGSTIISGLFIPVFLDDELSGIDTGSLLYGFDTGIVDQADAVIVYDSVNGYYRAEIPSIEDGQHTLYVRVLDIAGSVTLSGFQVTIDKGDPVIDVTAPTVWINGLSGVQFTARAVDAGSGCGINDNTWAYQVTGELEYFTEENWIHLSATGQGRTDLTLIMAVSGKFKVWFSVRDNAGNSGIGSCVISVDNEPPG